MQTITKINIVYQPTETVFSAKIVQINHSNVTIVTPACAVPLNALCEQILSLHLSPSNISVCIILKPRKQKKKAP